MDGYISYNINLCYFVLYIGHVLPKNMDEYISYDISYNYILIISYDIR